MNALRPVNLDVCSYYPYFDFQIEYVLLTVIFTMSVPAFGKHFVVPLPGSFENGSRSAGSGWMLPEQDSQF
jgi:hypothetical protein